MSSILKDVPQPIVEVRADLPRHLGRILNRCLEKDPRYRYSSATDLAYEIESFRREHESDSRTSARPARTTTSGSAPPAQATAPATSDSRESNSISGTISTTAGARAKRIAVLPFVNRSGKEEDDYFCDGLSEELINALSKLPELRVTARSSAFQFRGRELDAREVGQKLEVEVVLEGSVRIAGSRLRITTELVNCVEGTQLWAERFDSEMKDIFDTQDEIAQAIVEQLQVELKGRTDEPLVRRGTENLEAYHLLLKARHHMIDFHEPGFVAAHQCLEQAIALDPEYAEAYTVMSENYLLRSIFGSMTGAEAFPLVRSTARRALELDPNLGEAHKGLAIYKAWHDYDWNGALAEIRVGIEKNPQSVWSHFYHAAILATMRRGNEMVEAFLPALDLDPLNPIIAGHHSLFLFYAGRNDEAGAAAQGAHQLFPDYWFPHYMLSYVAWKRRDAHAAISNMERASELTGGDVPWLNCALAAMCYSLGRSDQGDRWLAKVDQLSETTHVTIFGRSMIECARGDADAAISWFERACAEHDTLFVWARAFGEQVGIIADDRIHRALERLGLP